MFVPSSSIESDDMCLDREQEDTCDDITDTTFQPGDIPIPKRSHKRTVKTEDQRKRKKESKSWFLTL